MKITVDSKSLAEAITWVTKNYDTKSSTANVVLRLSKKNEGSLAYSNNISFMKNTFQVIDVEATKEEYGKDGLAVALDGRFLQRLAGVLSGLTKAATITYDPLKNSSFELKTSQGQFTVPTLDVAIAREPKMLPLGEVDDREFFDALQRMAKVCDSNNGALPALNAVDMHLDVENKRVVMMGTDRYALGESMVDFDPSKGASEYTEENGHVLLPMEDAGLIAPSKGLASATTLVYTDRGNKFGYIFGDGRIALFALKDAEPMRYAPLKQNATSNVVNSVVVNLTELKKAITTISNLAWDETEILLIMDANGVVVSDEKKANQITLESGEDFTVEGEHTVRFVRVVLNKAFSPIATTKVKIAWKDDSAAFTLTPVLDDGEVSDKVLSIFIPMKK